ncbi:hypothetical protein B0H11DRAFT_2036835 [Mycena galericulata]|nr:hypothetical protein B0H11DRAFT_2076459 [Mycena galericulata]KAJ7473674.1 hypothetical protein B0H11DRAFT_2036835 [Mycena galericulata]
MTSVQAVPRYVTHCLLSRLILPPLCIFAASLLPGPFCTFSSSYAYPHSNSKMATVRHLVKNASLLNHAFPEVRRVDACVPQSNFSIPHSWVAPESNGKICNEASTQINAHWA